ncbi:unnamed protein product [Alternaria alternata]
MDITHDWSPGETTRGKKILAVRSTKLTGRSADKLTTGLDAPEEESCKGETEESGKCYPKERSTATMPTSANVRFPAVVERELQRILSVFAAGTVAYTKCETEESGKCYPKERSMTTMPTLANVRFPAVVERTSENSERRPYEMRDPALNISHEPYQTNGAHRQRPPPVRDAPPVPLPPRTRTTDILPGNVREEQHQTGAAVGG